MKSTTRTPDITITTLTLPEHWAGALVNGDFTQQSTDQSEDEFIREVVNLFGGCTGCSEESSFHWTHDATADGFLAGECLEYTFLKHKEI